MICRFFLPVFVSKHFRSFEIAFLVYSITIKQQKKTTRLCDTSPCQWLRESSSILSDFACYIFIYNRRRYTAYLNFTLTIKARVLFTSSSFRTNSIYAGSIAWLCSRATSNTTLTPFGPLQINMGRCQVAYSKKLNNNNNNNNNNNKNNRNSNNKNRRLKLILNSKLVLTPPPRDYNLKIIPTKFNNGIHTPFSNCSNNDDNIV